ncbi:MAG TPA: DUF4189 domain-containing protein, partial [Xanthobacteraceae bacterium]|nr:DUF4189 domain-containing protein [Xanthobacteraceae bacterium]
MTIFDRCGVGLAVMVLAQTLACVPVGAAGALAVGVAPGGAQDGFAFGMNSNKANAEAARQDAVKACGSAKESNDVARSRCKSVGTYTNQCAAMSMDPKDGTPGVGWAIAATSDAANKAALAKCEATA